LRPKHNGWIILQRLDWISEDRHGSDAETSSWCIVNNLNLNYHSGMNTQMSLQYGGKYYREELDSQRYSGYTDLLGLEVRQNLSRILDLGLQASTLHSWNADQNDYSAGASLGFSLLANTWISLGYNLTGFWDKDFSDGNFTAQGPFVRLRMKLDQESLGQILGRSHGMPIQ
jgi:hypothetical protein